MSELNRTVWRKNRREALKILREAGLNHEQIAGNGDNVRGPLENSKKFSARAVTAFARFFASRTVGSVRDACSVYGCNEGVEPWTEEQDRALGALYVRRKKPKQIRTRPGEMAKILQDAGFLEGTALAVAQQLAERTAEALSTRAYRIDCANARTQLRHNARTDAAMEILFRAGFNDPQISNGHANVVDALTAGGFGEFEAMEMASLFRGRSTKYLGEFRQAIGLVEEPTSWEPDRIEALRAARMQGLRGNDMVGQRDAVFTALKGAGYGDEVAAAQAAFLSRLTRSALNAAAVTYELTSGPHVIWTAPRRNAITVLHAAKFGIQKIAGHPAETEAALISAGIGAKQARPLAAFLASKSVSSLAGMIVELGIGDKEASERAKRAKAERKMTPAQREEWMDFVQARFNDMLQKDIVAEWNAKKAGKAGRPQVTISMTSKAIHRILHAEPAK